MPPPYWICLLAGIEVARGSEIFPVKKTYHGESDVVASKRRVVIGDLTGPWLKDAKDFPEAALAIKKAQKAVAKKAEFKGTVQLVETGDFVRKPEDSPHPSHGHHEFGNAETYFLVGDALAKGMLKLLPR